MRIYQIHDDDNVGVVLEPIGAGAEFSVGGVRGTARQAIPAGHKIALAAIPAGAALIKYGWPIGRATADIAPGDWVHSHNLVTGIEGPLEYTYSPQPRRTPETGAAPAPEFFGFRRADGRVGVRNELWIVPTVGCVAQLARRLAELASPRLVAGTVEGVFAFPHTYGCSQLGDDLRHTQRALAGLIRHPNAGGVLLLGLGCENNSIERQLEVCGRIDPQRVKFLAAQNASDETQEAMRLLEELAGYAAGFRRAPCPASALVLGMKCGGSDGFSGITANPLVGRISDMAAAWGASVLLTEVPEMFGAEQILMNRARDRATFEAVVSLVNGFKQYFLTHGQPVYENPAPGNRQGGITTLEEKSLGCIEKGGQATVEAVLDYGRPPSGPGLALVNAPGNDGVSSTALVIAGATLVLFTTGRGTPLGTPAPTLKISTNSALAQWKRNWIDFDAGRLLSQNADPKALAQELLQLTLDTASGLYRARNETNGMRDIAIFKTGVTV